MAKEEPPAWVQDAQATVTGYLSALAALPPEQRAALDAYGLPGRVETALALIRSYWTIRPPSRQAHRLAVAYRLERQLWAARKSVPESIRRVIARGGR